MMMQSERERAAAIMSHSYNNLSTTKTTIRIVYAYMSMYICDSFFFLLLNKPKSDEAERRNDDECQIVLQKKKLITLMYIIL